jgi:hypothetical protein
MAMAATGGTVLAGGTGAEDGTLAAGAAVRTCATARWISGSGSSHHGPAVRSTELLVMKRQRRHSSLRIGPRVGQRTSRPAAHLVTWWHTTHSGTSTIACTDRSSGWVGGSVAVVSRQRPPADRHGRTDALGTPRPFGPFDGTCVLPQGDGWPFWARTQARDAGPGAARDALPAPTVLKAGP